MWEKCCRERKKEKKEGARGAGGGGRKKERYFPSLGMSDELLPVDAEFYSPRISTQYE